MLSSKADKRIKTRNGIGYRTVVTSYRTFILHVLNSDCEQETRNSTNANKIIFQVYYHYLIGFLRAIIRSKLTVKFRKSIFVNEIISKSCIPFIAKNWNFYVNFLISILT